MHVMIDLETLGTDPVTAPIIQIAAVAFDLHGDGPVEGVATYQARVTAASNLMPPFNRRIDPDTVAWWADTDPALLVQLMQGRGMPGLLSGLGGLSIWFDNLRQGPQGVVGVWGNGATFDITMLEMAYKQEGMRTPWHFRAIRDVRTMAMIAGDDSACWEGGTKTEIEQSGRKHDALVDCMRQLRMVQQTWQRRVKHDDA